MINEELQDQTECLKFTRGVMKTEAHNRKITGLNIAHGGLDIAYDWRELCWDTVPKLIEEVEFLDRVVQELHDEREAAATVLRLERENKLLKMAIDKVLMAYNSNPQLGMNLVELVEAVKLCHTVKQTVMTA